MVGLPKSRFRSSIDVHFQTRPGSSPRPPGCQREALCAQRSKSRTPQNAALNYIASGGSPRRWSVAHPSLRSSEDLLLWVVLTHKIIRNNPISKKRSFLDFEFLGVFKCANGSSPRPAECQKEAECHKRSKPRSVQKAASVHSASGGFPRR